MKFSIRIRLPFYQSHKLLIYFFKEIGFTPYNDNIADSEEASFCMGLIRSHNFFFIKANVNFSSYLEGSIKLYI